MKSFENIIKQYLDQRSKSDKDFAIKYSNQSKTIQDCCKSIMQVARKRGNSVCMTDAEVYGLAVHYYDEDVVVSKEEIVCNVVSESHFEENTKKSIPPSKRKQAIAEIDKRQMSLF